MKISTFNPGGDNSVVERRVGDRKVADPWFDSKPGNVSLRPGKRRFILISHWDLAIYL